MKKNDMEKWHDWDVSSVGILEMKARPQKYITLEEVVDETLHLLSRYVLNITEEILVFTDLDVKRLNGNMTYLKKTYPPSRSTF